MSKPVETYLFCLDDHRSYSEEVKKRFSDPSRYTVLVSHNTDELKRHFEEVKEQKICKVVMLSLHDSKDGSGAAEKTITWVKGVDIRTGIILLMPPDKIDEVKKMVRFNVDAYIPRNANTILRTHNAVKKLISEHNLRIFRRRKTISLYALLIFFLLSLVFVAVAWFRLPHYF